MSLFFLCRPNKKETIFHSDELGEGEWNLYHWVLSKSFGKELQHACFARGLLILLSFLAPRRSRRRRGGTDVSWERLNVPNGKERVETAQARASQVKLKFLVFGVTFFFYFFNLTSFWLFFYFQNNFVPLLLIRRIILYLTK